MFTGALPMIRDVPEEWIEFEVGELAHMHVRMKQPDLLMRYRFARVQIRKRAKCLQLEKIAVGKHLDRAVEIRVREDRVRSRSFHEDGCSQNIARNGIFAEDARLLRLVYVPVLPQYEVFAV